jgi:signal transduction histidine kinase
MSTSNDVLSVLLIEDNPNDARLIERHLREADTVFLPGSVEIHHETTLTDGLERLEQADLDLLLLDLGLPESSGIETFERIEGDIGHLPVIVLTGLQDEQAAVDLLQRGAQDYLNKASLDRDRLIKSVRYALERQDREAELRRTSEQLEVLNRILRHDLKNDLQVLTGWLDTAQMVADGENTYLSNALDTVEHMEEMTANTREYMQLIGGSEPMRLTSVRLDELLSIECRKAESAYPDAEFEFPSTFPEITVQANGMLSSVFRNLLNNAVQHCDKDVPQVAVSVETTDDVARVAVADNGPGIPDDRKEQLFGKGKQGSKSSGTGIGLYLAETLVEEFGGRIWVADNDPEGTVFRVELDRQ